MRIYWIYSHFIRRNDAKKMPCKRKVWQIWIR